MRAVDYARQQLESGLGLLGVCAGGLDDASYNWKPGGTANSAAKTHVHAVTSVDYFINVGIRGQERLWTAFAAEHHLPENPREVWELAGDLPCAPMQEFAGQVQASALEYVASLSDEELDREVELQPWDTSTWMARDEHPSFAAILRDHAKLDAPVEAIDQALDEYNKDLY